MMGDDHARISAASKLAGKQLGCKVFRGSPYYRKEGDNFLTNHLGFLREDLREATDLL